MANVENKITAALAALCEDLRQVGVSRIPFGLDLLNLNVSMKHNLKPTGQDDEIYNLKVTGIGKNPPDSQSRLTQLVKTDKTPYILLMFHKDDN